MEGCLKPLSLYNRNVSSCVKINYVLTDWFNVQLGLRQGCIMSPVMFNLLINDLALKIKVLGFGIDIGDGNKLSLLTCTDDVVLLASSKHELPEMLNVLSLWCNQTFMRINEKNTGIVHSRPKYVTEMCLILNLGIRMLK